MNKETLQDAIGQRTQVAKNPRLAIVKDKLLLAGVVVVCVLIGVSNLLPKHKANTTTTQDEKQDARSALNQNMELIAKLQDNQNRIKTGYQGSNPNHPPQLRSAHNGTISKETLARMNAPSTFFSASGDEGHTVGSKDAQGKTLIGHDANSEFLNQQNDITSVSAKQLPHPALTVPAGEMIPATLETAINSELAGMARAIITRDIYALSGNKLLIPKGSTLVGQFNAGVSQGQSRIFVVWDRVQMTNGVIVTLNSPSTDAIGRSGQAADERRDGPSGVSACVLRYAAATDEDGAACPGSRRRPGAAGDRSAGVARTSRPSSGSSVSTHSEYLSTSAKYSGPRRRRYATVCPTP